MKKHYILSPLLLIAVAVSWNLVLRHHAPQTYAENIDRYLHPEVKDPNHPIHVYQFTPNDGNTRGDILARIPDQIYPEDKVDFLIDPGYGVGTIVHVTRALPVHVKDGKHDLVVRTWETTVGGLLGDIRRPLGDLDKANYLESDLLVSAMTVEVTRVAKAKITIKETVAFDTQEKKDGSLDRGVSKISQEGQNGEREKVFEVIREDGEEVSRTLLKDQVTKKPVSKIVMKGTKVKIGKTVTANASWYDICCTKVASTTFKRGTVLRLTNLANGKQIEVTVDDTGAFGPERVVDLHPDYFKALGGTLGQGIMSQVKAEEILNP
jgi:hypothetical protein